MCTGSVVVVRVAGGRGVCKSSVVWVGWRRSISGGGDDGECLRVKEDLGRGSSAIGELETKIA